MFIYLFINFNFPFNMNFYVGHASFYELRYYFILRCIISFCRDLREAADLRSAASLLTRRRSKIGAAAIAVDQPARAPAALPSDGSLNSLLIQTIK
jgi:hypothetical protein